MSEILANPPSGTAVCPLGTMPQSGDFFVSTLDKTPEWAPVPEGMVGKPIRRDTIRVARKTATAAATPNWDRLPATLRQAIADQPANKYIRAWIRNFLRATVPDAAQDADAIREWINSLKVTLLDAVTPTPVPPPATATARPAAPPRPTISRRTLLLSVRVREECPVYAVYHGLIEGTIAVPEPIIARGAPAVREYIEGHRDQIAYDSSPLEPEERTDGPEYTNNDDGESSVDIDGFEIAEAQGDETFDDLSAAVATALNVDPTNRTPMTEADLLRMEYPDAIVLE